MVARAGPRAEHRADQVLLPQPTQYRHRDHQGSGLGQIASHHHAPGRFGGGGQPTAQGVEISARRSRHRHQGIPRHGAHGGQIGGGDHESLKAHVVEGAEGEIDVHALDHQVGRPHLGAGAGGYHGAIVADPDIAGRG